MYKKVSNKVLYKIYNYEKKINKNSINVYKYYFYNRNELILNTFIGNFIVVHNGRYWVYININKWKVGYKIGSLT